MVSRLYFSFTKNFDSFFIVFCEGEGGREGSNSARVVGVLLLDLAERGLHVVGVLVLHVGVGVAAVACLGEALD